MRKQYISEAFSDIRKMHKPSRKLKESTILPMQTLINRGKNEIHVDELFYGPFPKVSVDWLWKISTEDKQDSYIRKAVDRILLNTEKDNFYKLLYNIVEKDEYDAQLLQPVAVYYKPFVNERYEYDVIFSDVDGRHRLALCKLLNIPLIPCRLLLKE